MIHSLRHGASLRRARTCEGSAQPPAMARHAMAIQRLPRLAGGLSFLVVACQAALLPVGKTQHMSARVVIYKLLDTHARVVYVGQTVNPTKRLVRHRERFGRSVQMLPIMTCAPRNAKRHERYWIRFYLRAGHPLQNTIVNGHEHVSEASREKCRRASLGNTYATGNRGKPKTPEHRAKISAAVTGNPRMFSMLGKKHKPETIRRMQTAAAKRHRVNGVFA